MMSLRTKCPGCNRSMIWTVVECTTEIRYHTCRSGAKYVIKVFPAKPGEVKGLPALFTVLDWTRVS